mmetsp:Transcript_7490/g.9990  ORF Transcript_7490/g.9990 Transcript_7490/m.9990 type:complete len:727 (+) Transcript_7490:321-2501(+)|eukprot:CAMPEP_0117750902 /NCGR_PEP_ID=MMETSP0947-20121206/10652_1 /TAXON_ID=44440 /ORGANISM="Chattonella subsalsa, Strain CCMP2191" /LENGTH=726 /DNA_ID=CAMNT_0005569173 /DNA_START=358 /DNA_END=2538 /DNA_ORIENTATION=-
MANYQQVWRIVLTCAAFCTQVFLVSSCTTIAIGKQATIDGSAIATHNADCDNCDFRLAKVPAMDWPEGTTRKVLMCKADYPNVLIEGRSKTWSRENLDDIPQRDMFPYSTIAGEIPQVNHTYGLLEGYYGIMNDQQVAIGESSCGGIFWAVPTFAGGSAMIDGKEITKLGLERGKTAREVIEVMGSLASQYGFYGSSWEGDAYDLHIEAGEAFSVVDPNEAWMFHILPDSTGTSAIWVAQRVPDDHLTIAANQFVIREVHPDDPDFMYSENLWEQAESTGKWTASDGLVDFTRVFGMRVNDHPHWPYSTRRMWKVFTHFAPSLDLSPYTTPWADDYPFSVKPDYLISVEDITTVLRSHYEGTEFDLTMGVAAGPYGDPDRYDLSPSLDGSVSSAMANSGFFERSLSIFRTSQTLIAQARGFLPNSIGPRIWYGNYAPSANVYSPIYVSTTDIPRPYMRGSLFQYTEEAMFWLHCSVGNYINRFRKYAIEDVQTLQNQIESSAFSNADNIDQQALAVADDEDAVIKILTDFSNTTTLYAWEQWKDFFPQMLTKYHDGYKFDFSPESVDVAPENFFYDESWLESTGYYDTVTTSIEKLKERGIIPDSVPTVGAEGNLMVREQLLNYSIPLNFSKGLVVEDDHYYQIPEDKNEISVTSSEEKVNSKPPEQKLISDQLVEGSRGGFMVGMVLLCIAFSVAGFIAGRYSAARCRKSNESQRSSLSYSSINP